MLSRNNAKLMNQRNAKQRQRFGIRKLTVGVASVLLGTTFFMGTAYADTNSANTTASNNTPSLEEKAPAQQSSSATITTQTGAAADTSSIASADDSSSTSTNNTQELSVNDSASANDANLTASLHQEATGNSLTDNGQTAVTLTHGSQDDHSLQFNVVAKAGDTVTVTVPSIFSASADSDQSKGVTVSQNGNTFTYSFTQGNDASYSLNLLLQPTVKDWSLLAAGDKYYVIASKNGTQMAEITYTIDNPSEITSADVELDSNQKDNLVTGQKYAVGVTLHNTGQNDNDNFKGIATIQVPTGFLLDANGAYGFSANLGSTDTTDTSSISSITQPGGAGTPVIIVFNSSKAQLNSQSIIFWGTYTQALSAGDNNFKADVTYQTVNEGQTEATTHDFVGSTQSINLPVTDAVRSNITTSIKIDEIATDNGTVNDSYQSDNDSYKYPGGLELNVKNDGNVVQTNVKLHLDVEPGTIFAGNGTKRQITFTTTGENAGITVVATLTDGSQVTLLDHHEADVNSNQDLASLAMDQAALDGSNIKSLDITFDKINAGSEVDIDLGRGAILSSATTKKTGDKATYSYSLTSDQGLNKSDSKTVSIVDPSTTKEQFMGTNQSFTNGTYDANGTGSYLTSGTISYQITHNLEDDQRPSSYLLVIPAGFHVDSDSDIHIMYNGADLPSDEATLTPLGAIGPAGEYVYRVDLSFTPGGNAVWVQKDNNEPLPLVINDGQGAGSYQYGHSFGYPTGIALLMEICDASTMDRWGNQAADFTSITLGGNTYSVVPSNNGWHGGFSDATYNFVAPSMYGSESGIKSNNEASYHDGYSGKTTEFEYSDNENGVPDITETSGQIRLSNTLTDGGTSSYSYNVINLPSVSAGQDVTLTLTEKGTIVGDTNNTSELLYSTTPLSKTSGITTDDLANFVTADQISDWSTVRAVVLKSNAITNGTVINAYLPFEVSGMKAGVEAANLNVENVFTGDHNGSTINQDLALPVQVNRYVMVTTNWIKKDANGTETPLKTAEVNTVKAGSTYTTTALDASAVPDGYTLIEPTNANGTTGATDVVVNYIYQAPVAATATITYVDDTTGKTLMTETAKGDVGGTIQFATKPSDQIKDYENQGYALVSNDFTNDSTYADSQNSFTVHLKHAVKDYSKTKTVTRTINYVIADGDATAPASQTQTATFTGTGHLDKVTGKLVDLNDDGSIKKNNDGIIATGALTWTPSDDTLAEVDSPAIAGYHVVSVESQTTGQADGNNVKEIKVDPNSTDITVIVTYAQNQDEVATLHFVDDDNDGAQIADAITAHGAANTQINFGDVASVVNRLTQSGYVYDSTTDDTPTATTALIALYAATAGKSIGNSQDTDWDNLFGTFTTQGGQTFSIHFTHHHDPLSQTHQQVVKETIHYVYNDAAHTQAANDATQTLTFDGTGYHDAVTNQDVVTDWQLVGGTTDEGSFAAVDNPVINGYHVVSATDANGNDVLDTENSSVKAQTGLTHQSSDLEMTVVYAADPQPAQPTTPDVPGDQPVPSDQPTTPVAPSDQPTTPDVPSDQPTPSDQPSSNGTTTVVSDDQSTPNTPTVAMPADQPVNYLTPVQNQTEPNNSKAPRLPQTGDTNDEALVGLGLTSLVTMLGLLVQRQKEN